MYSDLIDSIRAISKSPGSQKSRQVLSNIESLLQELAELKQAYGEFQPGHFHSPISSMKEIENFQNKYEFFYPETLAGIDLNLSRQLELLKAFSQFGEPKDFPIHPSPEWRYTVSNSFFCFTDALILQSMIRHVKPKRVLEIGSGYSSAVILDTNERYFGDHIHCLFVEPHPERFHAVLRPQDYKFPLLQQNLQDTDLHLFSRLQANDILFIDSSHVSKSNSDVNHFLFNILPLLQPGVYIHIHDIFFPFEYPIPWLKQGRHWNEAFLVRAFLSNNTQYEIQLFNHFLGIMHSDKLAALSPRCNDSKGGSLWIRKCLIN